MIERYKVEGYNVENTVKNESMKKIPECLSKAFAEYGNKEAVVMMIVHHNETNTFDQKWIEYSLWCSYHIHLIRKSLLEVATEGSLDEQHQLIV